MVSNINFPPVFRPYTQAPPPAPSVFVISGPSGVGKDAVIKRLQELRPELHMVVTATSRAMREGEVHGVDYFFVTKVGAVQVEHIRLTLG